MATQHAHGALAAELLEAGARTDAATGRGFTPLMLASMYGQHDLLVDLLDRGTLSVPFSFSLGPRTAVHIFGNNQCT